jgi:outer membrane receptor for ferrienterochelin and colicin
MGRLLMNKHDILRGALPRRTALALALGIGFSGLAFGQATTGSIFGQVPAGSADTVVIKNTTGLTRQVSVGASGRYNADALPLGTYTVTVQHDGQTVDSRSNVVLRVGAGTEVSFGASSDNAQNLSAVTVTANALPAIDVSSVDSRTVITSRELAQLPIARSAEAIALLAPGVIQASGYFTGTTTGNTGAVSFGGSSATENAYYINGFNTTDPLSAIGGLTLPYGAIDQQEILSGGYGAAYGRSDGGVISQVGKRGTNEWHFGGLVQWTPRSLMADQDNIYYRSGEDKGKLYRDRTNNKSWTTTYSAYVGGPLIKDKLFLFAAVEAEKKEGTSVYPVDNPFNRSYKYSNPKWYGKIDWNINDSNILEVTGASSKSSYSAVNYDYDYDTGKTGEMLGYDTQHKYGSDLYSAKFTSYITDDLTLTALYGQMKGTLYSIIPGYDPNSTEPHLYSPSNQNPALNGGTPINNSNTIGRYDDPAHSSKNTNLRVDLSYRIGDHTITAGIDNQTVLDSDDATYMSSPGYAWEYGKGAADALIVGDSKSSPQWVDAPGGYTGGETGYYVAKYRYSNGASVRTTQRAQYIEDNWQVTDRWLVKLGLRNDQFTNYNGDGDAYLRLTSPQWAPRLGFSWDVNGDSSFKVYGNAGRYYLALPSTVALRSAGNSLYTREYFTYTGIAADGTPTGLTPVDTSRGVGAPISSNSEYGIPRDPRTAAATNLESEYQDEFILGFDKKLNDAWNYGAKATYRNLRNAIDDVGDRSAIANKMIQNGVDPAVVQKLLDDSVIQGSYLFNPGRSNTFLVPKYEGGYYTVKMSNADFGFPKLKRHYYALEMYLEHPFDGKWFGKVDYVWSRSYGNSEGQVRSDIGQTDVSATVDWDYAQVMSYSNGALANDRRHVLKAYGSYQLTPEWLLSANLMVSSGAPKSCLGYYGPDQTNPGLGYGAYYKWCGGQPSPPGDAGRTPWQEILSLSAEYRPEWAGKKLAFNVYVYNVLDQQRDLQTDPQMGDSSAVYSTYNQTLFSTTPRYVRFGVTYDF